MSCNRGVNTLAEFVYWLVDLFGFDYISVTSQTHFQVLSFSLHGPRNSVTPKSLLHKIRRNYNMYTIVYDSLYAEKVKMIMRSLVYPFFRGAQS